MILEVGGLYWTKTRDDVVLITSYAKHETTYKFKGSFVMRPYYHSYFDKWTYSGEFSASFDYGQYDLVEEVTDPVILAFYQK